LTVNLINYLIFQTFRTIYRYKTLRSWLYETTSIPSHLREEAKNPILPLFHVLEFAPCLNHLLLQLLTDTGHFHHVL